MVHVQADSIPDSPTPSPAAGVARPPEELAAAIREFLAEHPQAVALEDGKVSFEFATAQYTLVADSGRCTLQLWSSERNLVRTVVQAEKRGASLRLQTQRFGHSQTKLLELRSDPQRRTRAAREPARKGYQQLLERVLARSWPEWQPTGFRTAMDLERSFGPAYARGSLVRGSEAWAVIGAGGAESQAILDGILTFGILWLHHCRERGDGRRLYKGLRIILPRGSATLTLARLPWLNSAAAQWQLFELDEGIEELTECDPADQGNLRTRLVHLPDAAVARERFSVAMNEVMELVPAGEEHRVEQRLSSPAELHFLLHGLEFARARLKHLTGSFLQQMEITCGQGPAQTPLTAETAPAIRLHIAELFRRRNADALGTRRTLRPGSPARSIGAFTGRAAHTRINGYAPDSGAENRLEQRDRRLLAQGDPLFRASPERWLESMLRENLAPLTRSLAPSTPPRGQTAWGAFANDPDPDTRGNRADPPPNCELDTGSFTAGIIPRFDPRHVYTQVPAIAGASDRGMLDLLGVTADGRLAVIEVKASDDIQLPLQGLDYWIRVLHHHRRAVGETQAAHGVAGSRNELQRHGYFRGVELSPLPPRLYLVAPALGVHPAAETVLRYLSPRVEWTLMALDERWRREIRVVWRKSGGRPSAS